MSVEIIDIRGRFPAPGWEVDRRQYPARYTIVHHSAGWYKHALTPSSPEWKEREEIAALAEDHQSRFGIGPGYHALVTSSQRAYVLNLHTHRAHTTGRGSGLIPHNYQGIGICALGDYESQSKNVEAIAETIVEVEAHVQRELGGAFLPRFYHGTTPSVNSANVSIPQATLCPGRHLVAALVSLATIPRLPPAIPSLSPIDAYLATMDNGFGMLGRRVIKLPPTDNDYEYKVTVPKRG